MATIEKRKAKGILNGTGYKVRTQLESAFRAGINLPVLPDSVSGETYPAICVAMGTLDLRTAMPYYVPTRDLWVGLPKSTKLSDSGESFTGDRAARMEAKLPTPNSLATAIRTYWTKYADDALMDIWDEMIVVGIPGHPEGPITLPNLISGKANDLLDIVVPDLGAVAFLFRP